MASVDDILGTAKPGSVDAILGPMPGPQVPVPGDWTRLSDMPTPPHDSTVMDRFIDGTAAGRVLDAFGQGFNHQFGSQPVLSPETEAAMAKAQVDPTIMGSARRAFNEVLFRPAASAIAGAWRGANAIPGAFGRAAGQVVNETGISTKDARDDFEGMGALAPVAIGTAAELGVIAKPPGVKGGFDPASVGHETPEPLTGEAVVPPRPSYQASSEGLEPQPHTLFEDQPKNPKAEKAGNINLERITASSDVKDVIRKTAADNGGFVDARRGEISMAETEQLADALGMTPESLNTRKIGAAFNAEEITAARNMLVQSATNVRDIAMAVKDGDEASLQAFVEAEAKHKSIQEQVAGITAEGGRALNAFKIQAKAVGEAQDFGKVLEGLGDSPEGAAARARAIGELDTPAKISSFINSSRRPTFKDQFLEYWINGLLSGPATHTTYAESNALLALWKGGVETPVAGAIGAVRGGTDRVFMGETGARLHGFAQGSLEGIPAAWRAIKAGVTEAMPGETQQPNLSPKIPGMAGQVITAPSRVIAGIHSYGRAVGYRMELNALAYREAAKAGLDGEDFATKLAQIKADPSEKMMLASTQAASEGTMMVKPDGGFGAKLESLANANLMTKMIAPFVRVGLNVVDQGLVQRTPLGLLSKDVRETLTGAHGAAARDTQIARMGVGSALGAGVISLAAQGYVTGGGPSDPKEAAMWRMTGKQPYSARIGDNWYAYHRLGSMGQIIGLAADMHEIGAHMSKDDATNIATLFVNSVAKNMIDETWMKGPADFIEAVRDPDRYGAAYIKNQLTTLMPFSVGMGQLARATDSTQHNTAMADPDLSNAYGMLNAIKAKIPGISQTVRAKYDIWGQPMENQGNLGPDALNAMAVSRVNNDPVNTELVRLGEFPAHPEQKIRGVKLNDAQYDEFQMTAGRLAKVQLDGLVNSEGWQTMPDFAQKELIQNTIRGSRQTASGLMQMRHPDLITQGIQNRIKQIQGVAK